MTEGDMRSRAAGLVQLPAIAFSWFGCLMLAIIGPAVIVGAITGYDPAWSPSTRILVGAFGVFLTAFLGQAVVFVVRMDVLGLPRVDVGEDGISIASTHTAWQLLGAVEIVRIAGRRFLYVEAPKSSLVSMTRADRFAASLNSTTASGLSILYLSGRQLRCPLEVALKHVPAEHRPS